MLIALGLKTLLAETRYELYCANVEAFSERWNLCRWTSKQSSNCTEVHVQRRCPNRCREYRRTIAVGNKPGAGVLPLLDPSHVDCFPVNGLISQDEKRRSVVRTLPRCTPGGHEKWSAFLFFSIGGNPIMVATLNAGSNLSTTSGNSFLFH